MVGFLRRRDSFQHRACRPTSYSRQHLLFGTYQPERKFLEVLVIHDKITVWHARDGALVKMNASMRSACWNKDIPRCRWPGFSMSPSRRFTAGRKRTAKADWQRYRRR